MSSSPPPLQTTHAGLDRDLVPYQLWTKAKALGTWDPAEIDFATDASDWDAMAPRERDLLLRLTAQFEGGEESVTHHLMPLLRRVAADGRLEEEMFLTAYLWEEAKHVEGFDRVLREAMGTTGDLSSYFTAPYQQLMLEELPSALSALDTDPGPEALANASVTYQMIVEGVLAETGYSAYRTVLKEADRMPGVRSFITLVQRDESRHVAYGVFLLSRLVAAHGAPIWETIESRMDALLPLVLGHIQETLSVYDRPLPFDVSVDQFVETASTQFGKRLARIERARSQSLDEVLYGSSAGSTAESPSASRPASLPDDAPPAEG
jgi:ribonucleoside-diphosphate reductase beta chain